MPEHWNPGNEVQQKVEVPIGKALKIIRSLQAGGQITTSNNISIFRQPGKFKLIVSSSKQRAGDVYLDPDILQLVDNKNFEKVSDRMAATLSEDKIDKLVEILQGKFSASVSLNPVQYKLIEKDIPKRLPRVKPVMIIRPKQAVPDELELEAMALEIELELLEFAA